MGGEAGMGLGRRTVHGRSSEEGIVGMGRKPRRKAWGWILRGVAGGRNEGENGNKGLGCKGTNLGHGWSVTCGRGGGSI